MFYNKYRHGSLEIEFQGRAKRPLIFFMRRQNNGVFSIIPNLVIQPIKSVVPGKGEDKSVN